MKVAPAGIAMRADARELTVLVLIAALVALVVLLYADSFVSMAIVWQTADYQHGLLVFPVSAYLLWRERRALAAAELRPCARGVLLLVPIVLSWGIARAVGVQTVEHFAAVLLIPATALTLLGWPLLRVAMFPLLFLVVAVPVGDALVPFLMQLTADLSTELLQAVGVPVFRQGQFLSLPGGEFEIADVCSGLRYLISGTSIGLLFAYLTYSSALKRTVFVLALAAAVILANGVRAFIVMWVASASDMRYLAGRDHVYFGWVLFGIVITAVLFVGARYADGARNGHRNEAAPAPSSQVPPIVVVLGLALFAAMLQSLPEPWDVAAVFLWPAVGLLLWAIYRRIQRRSAAQHARFGGDGYQGFAGALALAGACLVLAAGPGLLARPVSAASSAPTALPLPALDGCRGPDEWSSAWRPEFRSPDAVAAVTYSCSGSPVDVFVAAYRDNVQGRELVSYANRLLPDAWRQFVTNGMYSFASGGETIEVNEAQVAAPNGSSLIWYWYAVGDDAVTSATAVKVLQALRFLARGATDDRVYLVATPLEASLEISRGRLAVAGARLADFRVSPRTQ